jgi:putative membrane-bound dehydrogenase-like protein
MKFAKSIAALSILLAAARATADEATSDRPVLSVAEGFTIELVAEPPLVERPIVAAFDDEGRLYVAESSGSNDPVEKQLAERPHRIVCLEDADGDGAFDKRTVFADQMMFPEGTMFLDGSLYVSAPPSIWKLTDRDGDGVAEERVEWFQGKTLTGCANDLHGPYAGPDGWIYWCKGAFAEQTHLVNGREWKSRAAHIFRCRPNGTGLEPVMTGGMDNPVDVVFTPEGERIFSATFLEENGRRDGLAHAIYGGVYGKEHGVLDGHPRTGELMPAMALMHPAAPCGLERYDSSVFGEDFRDNLFVCEFNLRKVSRHVLQPVGSTFASEESAFVTSDHVDFHPTDVLMDADGSLLVIDTGGWYKLCCPTSQLWKPEVLGGIYRVRRDDVVAIDDPRGRRIDWSQQTVEDLWGLLSDARPAVRQRATRQFAELRGSEGVQRFLGSLSGSLMTSISRDGQTAALARTWALAQLDDEQARALVRSLLSHENPRVRQAAAHAASLHRDAAAAPRLAALLADESAAVRRVAAEALGRIGDRSAAPPLLDAAAGAEDRVLQHSIIYALIELGDAAGTAAGLGDERPGVVATALVALDQMAEGRITAAQAVPLLSSSDERLRRDAEWVVARHPEWGGELANWFREQLAAASATGSEEQPPEEEVRLEKLLTAFAANGDVQRLLAEAAVSVEEPATTRLLALRVMTECQLYEAPSAWLDALACIIQEGHAGLLPSAVAAVRELPRKGAPPAELIAALAQLGRDERQPLELRASALASLTGSAARLDDDHWGLLKAAVAADNPIVVRSAAAEAIAQAALSGDQLHELCEIVRAAGPLEVNRLLTAFRNANEQALGLRLLASLRESASLASLRVDVLRQSLAKFDGLVQRGVDELEALVNVDAVGQRERIEKLLPRMAEGDVRRGHAVFHSSKAACSACHRLAYAGGTVGPELSRIGEIRTERDLLESILYPSLSFVQSYEPTLIITTEGKAVSGRIVDETEREFVVATGPNEEVRIAREDVEEMHPGTVSVMPTGLDQQLSVQELADLVAFLKAAKE